MNVFNKIAMQGLKKNRTRTAVTIIGVALSSLMITAVTTFGVSLLDYMADGAIQRYGEWNAAFLDADPSFVEKRARDKEVKDTVSFENIGYARLEGAQNPEKPYLFVAGFRQETFDALRTTLMSGRLPQNDREILVSAKVSIDSNVSWQVGDTITLSLGNREKEGRKLTQAEPYSEEEVFEPEDLKTYTVVGLIRTPVFETEAAAGYTMITRSDRADRMSSLFVTLENPRKVYSYVENAKEGHACILNYDVLRIMAISDQPADKVFMTLLYSMGGIVLGIIMVGSIFLIYNSFSISLNERIREIGVLASVGATSKQLRNSVLFEGFCIGVVGIPIGVLAGLGGIGLVLSAVSASFGSILFSNVPLDMKVSPFAIGGAAAVSMITILISAYLPSRKAVNLPVMECIRQTNEIRVEAGTMRISQRRQRIYGLCGTLALKNFKRNRKRYRSIVLSLVLSIVLFVSTEALINTMWQTAGRFKTVSDYDIGFGTVDMEEDDLLDLFDKVKRINGITKSSLREVGLYSCKIQPDRLTAAYWEAVEENSEKEMQELDLEVHFFDDEFFFKMAEDLGLPAEEYAGQEGKLIAVAKMNDDSDRAEGAEDLEDLFGETSIDLAIEPKTTDGTQGGQGIDVKATTVEFVPPDIPPAPDLYKTEIKPYTFEILAPWSAKERIAPSTLPVNTVVKGICFESENPSLSEREIRTAIQEEGVTASYILMNTSEAFEQFRNYIFIANVFAYTFITLISLIAVANVFNTISTNIRLRRRELAMLRSVGMSDRDFNKMMIFECAFYGIKALMIGIPLSLVFSVLITKLMMTDDVKFTLPWAGVGISALSVFLVIFVTMMYAVRKIRKENIIDALRDEMT